MTMTNYLSAEQPIMDRIRAEVSDVVYVLSAADLDGVSEKEQFTPAVHVLYKGDKVDTGPGGQASDGSKQNVDQQWYAVVAVRNARTSDTGKDARSDAGTIVLKVLKALQGFKPTVDHGPMKRTNGADPGYSKGFLYVPLLFTTRVTI
jgi:hypothetical protein